MTLFESNILNLVADMLGDGYRVDYVKKNHNNDVELSGILIRIGDEITAPIIYFDDSLSESETAKDIVKRYRNVSSDKSFESGARTLAEALECGKISKVKENLSVKLVNFNNNTGYLNGFVHRKYMDLAILPVINVDNDFSQNSGVCKIPAGKYDMSDDEIISCAMNNVKESFSIYSISDFIGIGSETGMYVITNADSANGASCLLFPNVFKTLADKLNDNLIIIPSSIHELIAIKASGNMVKDIIGMINEVNTTEVSPSEVLSNNAYYYDRLLNRVSIAE